MPTSEGRIPWENTTRSKGLPRNWHKIRAWILDRDPYCMLRMPEVCTYHSTEVDHIGDNRLHTEDNLQGVCSECHKKKTSAQGHEKKSRKKRPPDKHPGLI